MSWQRHSGKANANGETGAVTWIMLGAIGAAPGADGSEGPLDALTKARWLF